MYLQYKEMDYTTRIPFCSIPDRRNIRVTVRILRRTGPSYRRDPMEDPSYGRDPVEDLAHGRDTVKDLAYERNPM